MVISQPAAWWYDPKQEVKHRKEVEEQELQVELARLPLLSSFLQHCSAPCVAMFLYSV
jgi:hypothetical protein